jgi:hypothetical protein
VRGGDRGVREKLAKEVWAMTQLQRRSLDFLLVIIGIVSVALVLLSHEDPFVRVAVCTHTGFCPAFAHAKTWYKILYDLGIGALVSLAFYLLVVRLPEYQRRQRLKRSLKLHYRAFRLDCIGIMLAVADGGYTGGQSEALLDPKEFKKYFKQEVAPGTERWHQFLNNLSEFYLRQLQNLMEQLRDELMFVLNNTDIPKDEPFEFLKRLSAAMYSMKPVTLDDDEVKSLARFLWDVFAGWSFVDGYRKEDIIEKMIDAI